MPAWIAGIQVRRMRPETSMSTWIPALRAGMTNRGVLLKVTEAPPPLFSKEITKHLARQSRNQNNRNISRKACPEPSRRDAKAQSKKPKNFRTLASWRLGARNIRIREFPTFAKFAQTAKTLSHSSTRFFPDCAGKKRFALLANSCNRKPNYLPQRRQGAKVTNHARHPERMRGI